MSLETHQISTTRPPDGPATTPASTPAAIVIASAEQLDELDVRTLPHGARHEIIFARLDRLAPGAGFVIRNDHDPKPLRYQTEALWPGAFVWTYLETGPLVWRVEITRAH